MVFARFFYAVLFTLSLAYNIVRSAWETSILCLFGGIDPQVVDVETTLKKDISHFILANSITLTPGTLTLDIDHEGGRLKVAVLTPRTQESIIPFERYIRGVFE
jgi:energy-converting hydrogenase B subunit A